MTRTFLMVEIHSLKREILRHGSFLIIFLLFKIGKISKLLENIFIKHSLVVSLYNVLSMALLKRLEIYAVDLKEYQNIFRRGKSIADNIFTLNQ